MSAALRVLRAGPLTVGLEDGGLRYVRLGDREVIRRIYVGIRDEHWATIPGEISSLVVDEAADAFRVRFESSHRQGPIDFWWRGEIDGEPNGAISFRMDGEARATFRKNRVGVCVLHPIEGCAGRPCRVRHGDGRITAGTFPGLIAPHQPFLDVAAIAHEVAPGVEAEVRFEGEEFEMEDQRNWSDASFKTYSTPQRLPKPAEIAAGTRVRHIVTLTLSGANRIVAPARSPAPAPVRLEVEPGTAHPLPGLGVGLPSASLPLAPADRARLAALGLAHLRHEVTPGATGWERGLALATDEARALAVPLELGLRVGDDAVAELSRVADRLRALRPPVAAYVVLPATGDATPPAALRAARAIVTGVDATAILGAGTTAHFTEVNRDRDAVRGADVVAFPNSPEVHMDDYRTLVENLETIAWIGETARSFAEGRALSLGPVTLRPPPAVDARHSTSFAAAWLVGHVAAVASARFARATYFEATGPGGVMPGGEVGGPAVFPIYRVLAQIGAMAGAEALFTRSTRPLAVAGLALRKRGHTRVLLANLTGGPQAVLLDPPLAGARVRRLDAEAASAGTQQPEGESAARAAESANEPLRLAPFEIVCLDAVPR